MARGDANRLRDERSDTRKRVAMLSDELSLLPRIDYSDPDQMAERCRLARVRCMECDLVPTMGMLAIALDVSISQLTSLADARSKGWHGVRLTEESVEILVKELVMLESIFDNNFENGVYTQPVTGIFAAKNLFGWKDTREVHQESVSVEVTPDQISSRYGAAIPMHVDSNGEAHMLMDGIRANSAAKKAKLLQARLDNGDFEPRKPPKNSGELGLETSD